VEAAGEEAWMRELKQWRSVQDVVVDNLLNITLKQKRGDSEKLVVAVAFQVTQTVPLCPLICNLEVLPSKSKPTK
jgi:hypothetical protein